MRRLSSLVLILALLLPLAIPFAPALAQEDTIQAQLEAYTANLPKGYGNVSVDDLAVELIENPDLVLVDVRQPDEYEAGHLPNALNIPLRDLARNLDQLPDLDAEIVVYCGTGFRSAIGMAALQILGYSNVRSMAGGTDAWNNEGYSLTTETVDDPPGETPEIAETIVAAVDAGLANIPEGWGAIKAADLNIKLIETPPDVLIDVRRPDERETGYIAGSVSYPLEQFMSFAGEWPADKAADIVVYCAGGLRGNMAATMLRTLGYTNVQNLAGGIGAWTTAGLPLEGAQPAAATEALDMAALLEAYIAGMPNNFNAIRANDLAAALAENPDLLLVDVRTVDEYAEGHLLGAINVPLIELTDHLDRLPNLDQPMVVYCGSGHRSALAMVVLNLLGYQNATSLLGGVKAWTEAELPVTTEETPVEAGTAPAFDPALFAIVDDYVKSIPANFYGISVDDLNVALIENPPFVIDVRTPEEIAKGYIQGAVPIELRAFMSQMDQWPADKAAPTVLYCSSDHRSVIALVAMQLMGYQDVRSMLGGLQAWQAKEFPIVTD